MCDHCGCRAFAPVADLTAEHEQILAWAWTVAEATREGGGAPNVAEALLALLDVHVAKEETGLYPLLREDGDLTEAQAAALEAEHRALRATVSAGGFDRRDYFALAAHIEEEEMELFPASMFAFDDDRWDELDAIHRHVLVTGGA